MSHYHHIFFDLDHTLWDFETNSRDTLRQLHAEMDLGAHGVEEVDGFIAVYEEINARLWRMLECGDMRKEVLRVMRFQHALRQFGVNNGRLAARLSAAYLDQCPRRNALMPGAKELLRDLHGHYRLHIITNGFEEVQSTKLACSGIGGFFHTVLTSERAGARKPDRRIFERARKLAGADRGPVLMVGDNAVADVGGARSAGWDQAHCAPTGDGDREATYRVRHFDELRPVLL
jgi:putative hydrolase of the HAD superfamily